MLEEFKKFVMRGNVLDLAVGIIMGASFGKIVTSTVNDIIMPPIGLLVGKVNFSGYFVNLGSGSYATLEEARKAGAATINYGIFINTVIEFLIVAFTVFLIVKQVNRLRPQAEEPAPLPATRDCPFCLSAIALQATRCPHCTSTV